MGRSNDIDPEQRRLFREVMRDIRPLRQDRVLLRPLPRPTPARQPDPLPLARGSAGHEDGEDEMVFTAGISRPEARRLLRGAIRPEADLDLHGCTLARAERELEKALRTCLREGMRCLLVIHGKGLRSPDDEAILRRETVYWLRRQPSVLAWCPARPRDGGSGALYVLMSNATA